MAIEVVARAALEATSSSRWVRFEPPGREEVFVRQETRGQRGADARYRRVTRLRHYLSFSVDEDLVVRGARSGGYWTLVTNDRDMVEAQLILVYKRQPDLEHRHHQLKSDLFAAPLFLRDPARIEGLMACQFLALLVRLLVELLVRRSMAERKVTDILIYFEDRPNSAPNTKRVFEFFKGITRHHPFDGEGHLLKTSSPTLTGKQLHLLDCWTFPPIATSKWGRYLAPGECRK